MLTSGTFQLPDNRTRIGKIRSCPLRQSAERFLCRFALLNSKKSGMPFVSIKDGKPN